MSAPTVDRILKVETNNSCTDLEQVQRDPCPGCCKDMAEERTVSFVDKSITF